jgi:hypothetical protein
MPLAELTTGYKLAKTIYKLAKGVRPAQDKLRQWLFLPTLEASNTPRLRYTALGSFWHAIGEGIEFSEKLAREPEGPKISRVALRSLGRKYDQAVVVVEAIRGDLYGDAFVFDETCTVSGVDKNPRVITLPSIPPYDLYITKTGNITETYTSFRVRITSLTEGGITRAVNLRSPDFTPLDQTLAQPHLWKSLNSELFHIGEIVWAKEEIRERLRDEFGDSIFARLIWSKTVATLLFWIPLVLRLREFKPRVYEEHSQVRKMATRDKDGGNTPSYAT